MQPLRAFLRALPSTARRPTAQRRSLVRDAYQCVWARPRLDPPSGGAGAPSPALLAGRIRRSSTRAASGTPSDDASSAEQPAERASPEPAPLGGSPYSRYEGRKLPRSTPEYILNFTCKRCLTRSSRKVSKQGYHHGTVLITCPGCANRHVISDHLMIFSDSPRTMEQILADKGEEVRRATAHGATDLEFLDDGRVKANMVITYEKLRDGEQTEPAEPAEQDGSDP